MAFKYNPLTGNLDMVGGGSATIPGGASTLLQYNNAGSFGGISGWSTNGTTELTGGAGTTLAIGGAAIGTNALAVTGTALLNGQSTFALNGAASTPSVRLSGTIFTGGTASTTQPLFLIMPTGTSWTNGSTTGTALAVNAASGFTGNLLDLQTNNTRAFVVDRVGQVTAQTSVQTAAFWENSGNSLYASSSAGGTQTKNTGFFGFSTTGNAFDTVGVRWRAGSGSPEGAVTAPVGSLYSRTDGGAVTSFYVKESGSGNTGWVAK